MGRNQTFRSNVLAQNNWNTKQTTQTQTLTVQGTSTLPNCILSGVQFNNVSGTFETITAASGTVNNLVTDTAALGAGINNTAVGNISPDEGTFTTVEAANCDSAVGQSGASTGVFTLLSATNGIQDTPIGSITPSTGVFTVVDATTSFNISSIENTPIGNFNWKDGYFTTLEASSGLNNTPINGTTGAFTTLYAVNFSADSMNNTVIGSVTPRSGSFTTLDTPTLTVSILGAGLNMNNESLTNVSIDDGAINGTTISSATVAKFSSISATTQAHIQNTNNVDDTPPLLVEQKDTGDTAMRFTAGAQSFVMGIDNSDSDVFKISRSTVLDTNNAVIVDATGVDLPLVNITGGTIDNTTLANSNCVFSTVTATTLESSTSPSPLLLGTSLDINHHTLTNVNIDGKTINNVTMGATTPITAATFTTLTTNTSNLNQLNVTTLATPLDVNDYAWTNVDINSGAIDGVPISVTGLSTFFSTLTAQEEVSLVDTNNTNDTPPLVIEQKNTGDSALQFSCNGSFYTMGIDNSDSDLFKISASNTLGTTDALTINAAGTINLTTVDINQGSIDNVTMGSSTATTATFSTLTANTGLSVSNLGANMNVNNQILTNANIDSGSIDGTAIGSTTPSSATFTTLTANTVNASGLTLTATSPPILLGSSLDMNNQILTNVDINDGSIKNTPINGSAATFSSAVCNGSLSCASLTSAAPPLILGSSWNMANHALTNVDLNSGSIDGIALSLASAAFSTLSTGTSPGDTFRELTPILGTYSPVLKLWIHAFPAAASNAGWYMRIGNMVWFQVRAAWTSKPTHTQFTCSLPFTISSEWPALAVNVGNSVGVRSLSAWHTIEVNGEPGDNFFTIWLKDWYNGDLEDYVYIYLNDNAALQMSGFYYAE